MLIGFRLQFDGKSLFLPGIDPPASGSESTLPLTKYGYPSRGLVSTDPNADGPEFSSVGN